MKRLKIISRDGFKCQCCGYCEQLEVDHIIPVVHGGLNDDSNLQTLCNKCNGIKRTSGIGWVEYQSVMHSGWNDIPDDIKTELLNVGTSVLGLKFIAPDKPSHRDLVDQILRIAIEENAPKRK